MDTQELNNRQQRKGRQIKQARLEIVAELYKRGKSIRQIAKEVKVRLNLDKMPSTQTIFADTQLLLKEWREYRITNTDELVQLELERIDDAIVELWDAWNKSKQDYQASNRKQKAQIEKAGKEKGEDGEPKGKDGKVTPYYLEEGKKEVRKYGDVSYISEIRQQLQERRKLLGLYAPDKRELTGANGKPLNPPQSQINLDELTEEEQNVLFQIALKRERKQQ
ncbi:hypothetical protein M2451_002618 [Dysgonomonas sp. PFB1-18]|uniref:hypothetical protein n=1 Tax=unclassified Dysgonomonas TaxID=2630389 RepID=UPI00247384D1|nr:MULTISPECIES: hypothetical protein [unclassified Dysgonomonas]MDH6308099.1 hypothetical protein [Dysgonomonas sp. PF1-14]MDH6339638.1 hypothetical protein [Dysgonomonas sp. PF1-16]MDH6381289.1 hypothetical protein [Dysgonomonas sp. PFB1-18]MDH6398501.1 hypothetical protein [Dysgonomonas sp. PF1-23]